ncbi:hypothetical protein HK100_007779 [Physocladia obscura]|uniref:Uncharacterized protein n=1 Tax=Physocladia obscura TaxID=109957 RepID=A0AAD5SUJ8_9FUNG|nr:hypothetical protein HK100_007779 [Physocladia obscura]
MSAGNEIELSEKNVRADSSASTIPERGNGVKNFAKNVTGGVTKGVTKGLTATMSVGQAFAAFINRGSVVDLAIGVVMGSAFTAIVNSFVNDLITPIIGLIGQKNLDNLFLVMHCNATSTLGCRTGNNHPYATVAAATADGAATWNYGNFIQAVINFILISGCMFGLVQLYSKTFLKLSKSKVPTTKKCAVCAEDCGLAAIKCKWCLTEFPVEEPKDATVDERAGFKKIVKKKGKKKPPQHNGRMQRATRWANRRFASTGSGGHAYGARSGSGSGNGRALVGFVLGAGVTGFAAYTNLVAEFRTSAAALHGSVDGLGSAVASLEAHARKIDALQSQVNKLEAETPRTKDLDSTRNSLLKSIDDLTLQHLDLKLQVSELRQDVRK